MDIETWKKANNLQSRIMIARGLVEKVKKGFEIHPSDLKIIIPGIEAEINIRISEFEREFEKL